MPRCRYFFRLRSFVQNARNFKIKTGKWHIESIDEVNFLKYVDTATNPGLVMYREALNNKNNVVFTKILKVSGFEAEFDDTSNIKAGLAAQLANGFNVNVVPADDKDTSNKIGFNLTFKRTSNKKINVSSTGEFSLFGQVFRRKDLQ